MTIMNYSKASKLTRLSNATAAGTGTITSSSVDMTTFETAVFYVAFGTIVSGAATSIKVQGSSDDGSSDAFADLLGTSITVTDADDNKLTKIEIFKPVEKFLRILVLRATQNSTVDAIWTEQYGAKKLPVDDDSTTVVTKEFHQSPAEGTA